MSSSVVVGEHTHPPKDEAEEAPLLAEEAGLPPLPSSKTTISTSGTNNYGSTALSSTSSLPSDSGGDTVDAMASFHLGSHAGVNRANVLTSMRMTESFLEHGQEYRQVPTQRTENMHLLCDTNLMPGEKGQCYMAERSLHNPEIEPSYVLTVNPDLYFRVLRELHDRTALPLGLYNCCHDATGFEESDFVDIRVAYTVATIVFSVFLSLSIVNGTLL